jgi:hypothetical protein
VHGTSSSIMPTKLRFIAALLGVASFAQTGRASAQTPTGPHYRYVSLMPGYWRFREGAPSEPDLAATLFRRLVVTPNQRVFSAVAADWMDDRNLQRFVTDLRAGDEFLESIDSLFPLRFRAAWTDFARTFTDLRDTVTIYLIPAPTSAVGGAVRLFGDSDVVIFGAAEALLEMKSSVGFKTSVEHELTHLYQAQVNAEMRRALADLFMNNGAAQAASLYQIIWLEGLATWVSSRLNPDATAEQVFRSQTLEADVRVRWPVLRDSILSRLDSTKPGDINDFVFGGNPARHIPRRAGYYVGALVAAELGKRYSYAELARLSGGALRREFEEALQSVHP